MALTYRIVKSTTGRQESTPVEATMEKTMSNAMVNVDSAMEELMKLRGAVGAALADYTSGMCLAAISGGGLTVDTELAAAGHSEVIRSKIKVMDSLRLKSRIEDILITLSDQYHLIRLLSAHKNLFLYLVLKKEDANLATARHKLTEIESYIDL
jgi:hypothetical protein